MRNPCRIGLPRIAHIAATERIILTAKRKACGTSAQGCGSPANKASNGHPNQELVR